MTLTKSSAVSVTWSPGLMHACRGNMTNGVMLFGFDNIGSGDIEAKAFALDSPLTTGITATVDTGYTANEARIEYITDDTAVIAWQDSGALYAAILTLTSTSISAGAVRTVLASGVNSVSIAVSPLGTGALIFGYLDTADSDFPKAVVCTISGTTISAPGTAATLESVGGTKINIAGTSATGAIAGYNDADFPTDIGRAVAMTISGTTITPGTPANITGTWVGATDFSALRSHTTDAAVGLYVVSGENGPSVKIFSQSGTTLSQGTRAALDWAAGPTPAAITQGLDVSSATLAFYSFHQDGELYAGEIIISGTSISSVPSSLSVATVAWETQIGAIGTIENGKAVIADTVSDEVYLLTSSTVTGGSHLWLSSDGAATFTDIGDTATWASNLVGGVVVKPGTAYQTIWAMVGTVLYKTTNGGTSWSSVATVGYEADFLDLLDGDVLFVANRAAGGNRASLVADATGTVTHINTSKSTTGGATSGQGVA